jgi:hypothetical protein
MIKPIRILKTVVSFIAVGSASLFLAACYGSPISLKSFVAKVRDKASQAPIKGLVLEMDSSNGVNLGTFTSGADGTAQFEYDPLKLGQAGYAPFTIKAEDTDGATNGGPYKTSTVQTDGTEDTVVIDMEE